MVQCCLFHQENLKGEKTTGEFGGTNWDFRGGPGWGVEKKPRNLEWWKDSLRIACKHNRLESASFDFMFVLPWVVIHIVENQQGLLLAGWLFQRNSGRKSMFTPPVPRGFVFVKFFFGYPSQVCLKEMLIFPSFLHVCSAVYGPPVSRVLNPGYVSFFSRRCYIYICMYVYISLCIYILHNSMGRGVT